MESLLLGLAAYVAANPTDPFFLAIKGAPGAASAARFYEAEADADCDKPYAVYHAVGGTKPYRGFCGFQLRYQRVQISLYDDGVSDATYPNSSRRILDLSTKAISFFDNGRFALGVGSMLGAELDNEPTKFWDSALRQSMIPIVICYTIQGDWKA